MLNRTIEFEENLRKVEQLRNEAIACRTMARAYSDYAGLIASTTYGTLADAARVDLVDCANLRAARWTKAATSKTAEADRREQNGI